MAAGWFRAARRGTLEAHAVNGHTIGDCANSRRRLVGNQVSIQGSPARSKIFLRRFAAVVGLAAYACLLVSCGSSPGEVAESNSQVNVMESINRDRSELIDGALQYSRLVPVRIGATEMFHVWLIAYTREAPVPKSFIRPRDLYNLRVGGVEGATLTAASGGVTITAIGPTRGLIGKPNDEVEWSWSLKPTQPGTYVLDLVVVTYQGQTSNPLYTLNPPLVLTLVAKNSFGHSVGAVESALLPIAGIAGSLAAVIGVVLTWMAMRNRKRRHEETGEVKATRPASVAQGDSSDIVPADGTSKGTDSGPSAETRHSSSG
jgi:hypothetical protein